MNREIEKMCDAIIRRFGFEDEVTIKFFQFVENGVRIEALKTVFGTMMKMRIREEF